MNLDTSEYQTSRDIYTYGENITFITHIGNEMILQNERGTELRSTLKQNYIPLASKSYNGILYIISAQVIDGEFTGRGEIGTFPSPDYENTEINERGNLEGDLIEEYRPFMNYSGDLSIPINPINGYGEFNSARFNFSDSYPVEIVAIQPSYDNSVNVIFTDNINRPKIINSRFTVLPNNRFEIVERLGDRDDNQYDEADFTTTLNHLITTNTLSWVKFDGQDLQGGQLLSGNYQYYFRYVTRDGNRSDIIAQTFSIPVFIGNSIASINGGRPNQRTNKSNRLILNNLDSNFFAIRVYFTYSQGELVDPTVQAFEINRDYPINQATEISITHSGFEPTFDYSIEELSLENSNIFTYRTGTELQGRLFIGNITAPGFNINELKNFASQITITHRIKELSIRGADRGSIEIDDLYATINFASESLDGYEAGYYNPYNVNERLGYWAGESYCFAIEYYFRNGSKSPLFPIRGIDNINGTATYSMDDTENFIESNSMENVLGIYRFPSRESLNIDLLDDNKIIIIHPEFIIPELPDYIKEETIGFRIHRVSNRKRDVIMQGIGINTLMVPNEDYIEDTGVQNRFLQNNLDLGGELVNYNQGPPEPQLRGYSLLNSKFIPAPDFILDSACAFFPDSNIASSFIKRTDEYEHRSIEAVKFIHKNYMEGINGQQFPENEKIPDEINKRYAFYSPDLFTQKTTYSDRASGRNRGVVIFGTTQFQYAIATPSSIGILPNTSTLRPNIFSVWKAVKTITEPDQYINTPIDDTFYRQYIESIYPPNLDFFTFTNFYDNANPNAGLTGAAVIYFLINPSTNGIEFLFYYNNPAVFASFVSFVGANSYEDYLLAQGIEILSQATWNATIDSIDKNVFTASVNRFGSRALFQSLVRPIYKLGSRRALRTNYSFHPLAYNDYLGLYLSEVDRPLLSNFKYTGIGYFNETESGCAGFFLGSSRTRNIGNNEYDDLTLTPRYTSMQQGRKVAFNANIYPRASGPLQPRFLKDLYTPDSEQFTPITSWTYWGDEFVESSGGDPQVLLNNRIEAFGGDNFVSLVFRRLYNNQAQPISDGEFFRLARVGQTISFVAESNTNPAFRSEDIFDVSEGVRSFAPFYTKRNGDLQSLRVLGDNNTWRDNLLLETEGYNTGFSKVSSDKTYVASAINVPFLQTRFDTRIQFSEPYAQKSFTNGYRYFLGFSFKDYASKLGQLVSLKAFQGSALIAVFEFGVCLIPVNQRIGGLSDAADNSIFFESSDVLPPENAINYLSEKYGSRWQFSVVSSDNTVYGVDIDGAKIWRVSSGQLELISDFRVQKFLRSIQPDYLNAKESRMNKTIRSYYDPFKQNIVFTFLNSTICGETIIPAEGASCPLPLFNNGVLTLEGGSQGKPERRVPIYCPNGITLTFNELPTNHWLSFSKVVPIEQGYIRDRIFSFNSKIESNLLWEHYKSPRYSYYYNQQEEVIVEFIVSLDTNYHQIFENLVLVSNHVYPSRIEYTTDAGTFVQTIRQRNVIDIASKPYQQEPVNSILSYDAVYRADKLYITIANDQNDNRNPVSPYNRRIRDKYCRIRLVYSTDLYLYIKNIITLLTVNNGGTTL
jgi:hypothetical protein